MNRPLARLLLLLLPLLTACSSEKFLHDGETLLSNVQVASDSPEVKAGSLRRSVRQEPNARWFGFAKVPLGIYCMSSADSVRSQRGFQRMLQRIGEAPAVYDSTLTRQTLRTMTSQMRSEGFLHAGVTAKTTRHRHKTKVFYMLHPAERFYYEDIRYMPALSAQGDVLLGEEEVAASLRAEGIRRGLPLRYEPLENLRASLISNLRGRGFYGINRDFLSYRIDTASYTRGVDLTLLFSVPSNADAYKSLTPWRIGRINVFEGRKSAVMPDTVTYRGLTFISGGKRGLNKRVFAQNVALATDSLYSDAHVSQTYARLNALPVVAYTTLTPHERQDSSCIVDYDLAVYLERPHHMAVEVEGTNTAGDLGVAASLTYANKNLFKGSEQLSLKLRGAYEAIRGLEGYSASNYLEYSAEMALRFPTLLVPRRRQNQFSSTRGTSEASILFNSQDRPEFHRRVWTAAWSYRWTAVEQSRLSHKLDLVSLNYVYMPWISDTFRKNYLEATDARYSVLRYSYEDLFIMNWRYLLTLGAKYNQQGGMSHSSDYQLRFAVETAGNLLYGISRLAHAKKDAATGSYKALGIAYSQYVKVDFDYSRTFRTTSRSSLAFHVALGIAQPYANSTILPYEKRYFAGGANGVRGWSVRSLGPGSYKSSDGKVNFINQTGNLKLDLSAEWRSRLFWKFDGAVFIDAGNIWNTRSYDDQPGGLFKISTFYREIAVAYGVGLRLDFNYFVLRFDGGMKAINPSEPHGRLHYPIAHPDFSRDFTFHFAVGLPF